MRAGAVPVGAAGAESVFMGIPDAPEGSKAHSRIA